MSLSAHWGHRNAFQIFIRILYGCCTSIFAAASWAQSTDDSSGGAVLSEVVVTATKRSENIQDVPIAISALSGKELQSLNLSDPMMIASLTPNLSAESGYGAAFGALYRLRGVGTNEFTTTLQPAVGVYMDEVVLDSTGSQGFPIFDIDRVEVLKGPQGTLWGKNTTAGAISYTTRRPTATLGGYAQATLGSAGTREFEGAISGPLADDQNLLGRLSVVTRTQNGQFINDWNGEKVGFYRANEGRAQLLWKFSGDGDLLLSAHSGRTENEPIVKSVGVQPDGTDATGFISPAGKKHVSTDTTNESSGNRHGASLHLNYRLPHALTLTDILAYERNTVSVLNDDDATPTAPYTELTEGGAKVTTNELRIASEKEQRFAWILGTFFLNNDSTYRNSSPYYSPADPQFGTGLAEDFLIKTKNYALFGDVSTNLTKKLTLSVGARWTKEQKRASGSLFTYITQPSDLYQTANPGVTLIDTSTNTYVDPGTLAPVAGPTLSKNWSRFTGDVTLSMRPTDTALLYARVAQGFRSGNFNLALAAPADLSTYNPETLRDYELGAKSEFFDHRLRVDIAAFHYDYRDIQVSTVTNGLTATTQNAASARLDGAEAEVEGVLKQFYLSAGLGYTRAKYRSFPNASVPTAINQGVPLDLSGQRVERTPKITANVNLHYDIPLPNSATLLLQTDWRYRDGYPVTDYVRASNVNPQPFLQGPGSLERVWDAESTPSYTIGNARIAYESSGDRMEVSGWVKNITNRYHTFGSYALFFNREVVLEQSVDQRTYGITLAYNFH